MGRILGPRLQKGKPQHLICLRHMTQGAPIPKLLYGTAWKEERTEGLTNLALAAGFCGIDTANQRKHYFEAAVGAAVHAAGGARALSRAEPFPPPQIYF